MIKAYCDGSCLNNQDPENARAGSGFVIVEEGDKIAEDFVFVGSGEEYSNNTAEYEAVIEALKWREENRPEDDLAIHTDSELVTKQIEGEWGCNASHLFTRLAKVRGMLRDDDMVLMENVDYYMGRAHDLAQAGAAETDPPEKSTAPTSSSRGSASRAEPYMIEPDVLDKKPGPLKQPHDGIVVENIPDEMARRVQWINWKVEERERGGEMKEIKIPVQPGQTYKHAKSNDESTWSDLKTAIDSVSVPQRVVGIGYVLAKTDPFVAIDLDDVRNPDTGEVDDWAMRIVDDLRSYAHVSASNTGVHVFVKADGIPDEWTNKKEGEREIEVYDWGRFMAFTGHLVNEEYDEILEIPKFDHWLLRLQRVRL